MGDERLKVLQKLSTIELMPRRTPDHRFSKPPGRTEELLRLDRAGDRRLARLPALRLQARAEPPTAPAGTVLDGLDDELDELLANWTRTLLTNLEDPATKRKLETAQVPTSRKLVNRFIEKRALPDNLDQDFIDALREVFSDLQKVPVKLEDLRAALLSGGSPATPDEMKTRFEDYLDELIRGKEPRKVRIVLE